MRVFTASLATETNTFSPVPTDRLSFESAFYAGPGEHPETPTLCSAPIPVLRARAREEGFTLIEGTATWAEPGGYVRSDVYEELRDEILDQLRAAMPVDCVVLGLHGAMVARDYDDCEGDLLTRVREIVGPDTIVAAELDPHSHLTKKRLEAADILAAFLEFPHTDFLQRGEHVVDLALRATRGEVTPQMAAYDCRMIDIFPTSKEPMRSFVDKMTALQGRDGILSVSLIHGFMAADVPEMGTQVLVVADGDHSAASNLAERLGHEVRAMRGTTKFETHNVEEVLDTIEAPQTQSKRQEKPYVLADVWDNPGGGVAGDNTAILRAIIERGIKRAGIATLWDPLAASFAVAAGEGAVLDMRLGGKAGAASGPPIDARVEVLATAQPGWQSFGTSKVTLGTAAAVRLVGTEIDVILNTNRTQTFEPDIFSNLGVNVFDKDILVIKSTNHFYAGFKPIAREIFYVATDGVYPTDPRKIAYSKLKRPIWPMEEMAV
ncbi:MAG: M81 family metallopeptidase [Pseudomonadota bacterium]